MKYDFAQGLRNLRETFTLIPLGPDGTLTAIDLFCGAGGVSQGLIDSEHVYVEVGVNHSPAAIEAHTKNHPFTKHFTEDIEALDVMLLPSRVNILWASTECTHLSNAKGGQARDADSRTLADHLDRYVIRTNPDYFIVENVKEFLTNGPLIQKRGKRGRLCYKKDGTPFMIPDPTRKCEYYNAWVERIKSLGYHYEYRLLNAADYGAHTTRVRYFGVFARIGLPIMFPKQTHSKDGSVPGTEVWKACKEKIRIEQEGESIFARKFNLRLKKNLRRKLVEATQKRVAYGINKYELKDFISKSYSSGGFTSSLAEPLHAVTVKDRHALISLTTRQFITQHAHGAMNAVDVNEPLNTILAYKDLKQMITVNKTQFITSDYTKGGFASDINGPLPSILTNGHHRLTTVSEEESEDDKRIVKVDGIEMTIAQVKEIEKREFFEKYFGKYGKELVEFLCAVIKDIKMRYLTSRELADVTGFPPDYDLGPNETTRKKHVGNAVPPVVPNKLAQCIWDGNFNPELENVTYIAA